MSAELTPDLAEKVLSAAQRNLVKKVGEGGTLTTAERQLFMGFSADGAEPEQLLKQRINALLRKWLDGGRLSADERDEIAHVLPDARLIIEAPQPVTESVTEPGIQSQPLKRPLTEKEILQRYEISRATYFRWRQYGLGLPDGQDLPPWDEPSKLVAWYEKMKQRGIFKHKCPKSLLDAAKLPASATASTQAAQKAPPSESTSNAPRQVSGKRGFLAELEALQEQTALMREGYENALKNNELEKAAGLRAEYFSTLETLRKYEKDKEQIATACGELVRKSEVEKDLAERLPAVVSSLEYLIDTVDPYLISEPDRSKRRAIWRKHLADCFKGMATSRYAPPFSLAAT